MGSRLAALGPVGRFSLSLAGVLALTAVAVALATSLVIGRYVEDETVRKTGDSVASHFGTVFSEDVFRTTSQETATKLRPIVVFHFGIYDIVSTRFYGPDGTVVFSYSPNDIGDRPEDPRIGETLAGNSFSERVALYADGRIGRGTGGGEVAGVAPEHAFHAERAVPGAVGPGREVNALESWIPVSFPDGLHGAVVVWRDMAPVDEAVRSMQIATSAIIAFAALLLWVVLRGVYVRSSNEIRERSRELGAALAETERSYDATLSALSSALDVRDSETEGHARRVVQYLELIADELGAAPADRNVLLRGALLHDVGKIGVPDEVLRKPGPLTSAEWATMRRHPSYGARIVAGVPFLESVAAIIKHHHERWDGAGYPDGLRGEEIPLGARMFAVADSYDAMTADRPYRKALDAATARAEVERGSGTQFDPRVVEAFLRIPAARLDAIAPEHSHQHHAAVA